MPEIKTPCIVTYLKSINDTKRLNDLTKKYGDGFEKLSVEDEASLRNKIIEGDHKDLYKKLNDIKKSAGIATESYVKPNNKQAIADVHAEYEKNKAQLVSKEKANSS